MSSPADVWLFLYFAAALALEAVDRIILVRLVSYLSILRAVIEKNSHQSR